MDRILLGHGSGGKLMHDLIKKYIAPVFELPTLMDSAIVNINHSGKIAITTDSYTVSPIFFPGGDIGDLAINGTVNDLSVVGAIPLYLTVGFILEEGFQISDFERILKSISKSAKEANIKIVAGDTKVVDKGKGDGIFINTSGIGIVPDGVELSPLKIEVGDKVLISGSIGNHGIAVMAERNGFTFEPPVLSDTRPLNGIINEIMKNFASAIKIMRDPTRGGVATTLKELAVDSGKDITIYENSIPVHDTVKGACDLLGLDPLYVANEGIFVAIVESQKAEEILELIKKHPFGKESAIIGEITGGGGKVLLKTSIGGTRLVDMLPGEQLPRIC
ncbi:[NiFe] hydrogenase metallocenter assembly protein HypE [Thermodesulfovibrio sp. N1]|uniref:hydrogenase expression/formation protein HypE n=1 Tax=unclassified Thermodesulfovibrio TaxID=2645936 RepID=UPI00083AA8AA|nr:MULTISPECIES: hydrogenase expression/formation protein HypE [unclassified Thermodesulfovibrio]MDI1471194.1 hydrogenase expression/formation protein HypE [Thermodesulfovibrio sp. 1176]ODA45053.1 [NiFe] hydrogenase metallocenter assembly protein HypE [Thermodesulfovibrio sp. N1]